MKKTAIIVLIAAFFTLWMSLKVSRENFARLPHLEDEYAYTYQAKIFAGGNIYLETPAPRRAFWQPFLIDEGGKRFGKYPPGYPLILAVGYLLNFPAIINAWLAFLNVGLTYRLGREVFNEATGAVAAVLMAISPIAVLQNATLMPHPATLFLTTLTLYAIWRLEKGTHLWRWGIVAGLALGFLVAVRPFVGVTVAIPLIIYSLVRLVGVMVLHRSLPTSDWRTPRWASLRAALYHGDSSSNQWLRRDTAPPCPPAVHHNDSFPTINEGELLPTDVWWLKVLVLWIPIALLTGAAYWVSSRLPFYDNWYVLAIGLGMAVMALGYVVLEWSDERVNPPLPRRFIPTLMPLLLVAVFAILLGMLHPLFSYAVVGRGDPFEFAQDMAAGETYTNLYTYVWEYDTPGFGPEHGREGRVVVADIDVPRGAKIGLYEFDGHTWLKAKEHLREDLKCYSRDLFGWVPQPDNPPDNITPENGCVVDRAGISWGLLPLAFIFGWRRRWLYVMGGVAFTIILGSMWFWIGAQTYSARYYYEATSIFATLSAFGLVSVASLLERFKLSVVAYALLGVLVLQTVTGYTPRRLEPLETAFTNRVRLQLERAELARQHPEQPLVIIAWGDIHWREINAYMAVTSPYLDSDIILLRDPDGNTFWELAAMFPDREILYLRDGQLVETLLPG